MSWNRLPMATNIWTACKIQAREVAVFQIVRETAVLDKAARFMHHPPYLAWVVRWVRSAPHSVGLLGFARTAEGIVA